MRQTKKYVAMLLVLVISGGTIAACTLGPGPQPIATAPTPTAAVRSQPEPVRPALLIQYCDDVTTSYPRADFQAANALIANALVQSVGANQGGVTLYATAITHNTFDPANTLAPVFKVPAIAAYQPTPTVLPTYVPQNPNTDPPTETAIANARATAIASYNGGVLSIDQQIQHAQAAVTRDVGRLKTWNPPPDNIATSILGCFQLAAQRFAGQPGVKLIYLATDFGNNTYIDNAQPLVTQHQLAGVIVHAIYFYSPTAVAAAQTETQWCSYLLSAGAKSVTFNDPSSSQNLADVFDKDAFASAHKC